MAFHASKMQPAKAILICFAALMGFVVWQSQAQGPLTCPPVVSAPAYMPLDHPMPHIEMHAESTIYSHKQTPIPFSSGLLAPFVLSLEPGTTAAHYYASHVDQFCNKCDFHFYQNILLPLLPCCSSGSIDTAAILLGGLNNGQLADLVLDHCKGPKLHGFEIQEDLYESLLLKFSPLGGRMKINNAGMSNIAGEAPVASMGSHETAGLFQTFRNQTVWDGTKKIRTVRLDDYVDANNLAGSVCLTIIDVEGHESKVLQGMDLPSRAADFPVLAYELGGTWAKGDTRRAGSWLQADAARFLTNLGYQLYLIGSDALLSVDAAFFEESKALDEGYGPFVQGNLLAVWEALRADVAGRSKVVIGGDRLKIRVEIN